MAKDRASIVAEEAYAIYLGMIEGPHEHPAWDDIPRWHRGLLEWTARYSRFSYDSDRDAADEQPADTGSKTRQHGGEQ